MSDLPVETCGEPRREPVPLRLRRLAGRLRGEEHGATAIEFAVVAPVFAFLMFVIAETAMVFIAEQVMENAVFETSRLIRTGQAQLGSWPKPAPPACGGAKPPCPAAGAVMTKADFRREICKRTSVFLTCDATKFYLEVKTFATLEALGNYVSGTAPVDEDDGEFKAESYDPGTSEGIVLVRAHYKWPVSFSKLESTFVPGKRLLGSFAAFKNEPYDPDS